MCLGSLEESEELQLEPETSEQAKKRCQMPCYSIGVNADFSTSAKKQRSAVLRLPHLLCPVPPPRQSHTCDKSCDVPFPEGALDFVPQKFLPFCPYRTRTVPALSRALAAPAERQPSPPQVSFIWRHGCGRLRLK